MTPAELLALAEKATPQPWAWPYGGAIVAGYDRYPVVEGSVRPENAAYIVAAANEAPALARRVMELEAALRRLRGPERPTEESPR